MTVGREALESSSAVLQTAATPSQLPAQTKKAGHLATPGLEKRHLQVGCGRHKRNGYTDSEASWPAPLFGFRSDFKSDTKARIVTSATC